ncbi:MAG: LEA type 2 family protein [Acidiferrobacterales bacterium]
MASSILASTLMLSVGCASVGTPVDTPHITLAGVWLVDINLLEQRYRMRLRIQNPNPFSLNIDGLDYRIEINDKEFARGVSNQALSVPRYGVDVLEVEAVSTLAGIMRQLVELEKVAPASLKYRLTGKVSLRDRTFRVPFDYEGEFTLAPRPASGIGS